MDHGTPFLQKEIALKVTLALFGCPFVQQQEYSFPTIVKACLKVSKTDNIDNERAEGYFGNGIIVMVV